MHGSKRFEMTPKLSVNFISYATWSLYNNPIIPPFSQQDHQGWNFLCQSPDTVILNQGTTWKISTRDGPPTLWISILAIGSVLSSMKTVTICWHFTWIDQFKFLAARLGPASRSWTWVREAHCPYNLSVYLQVAMTNAFLPFSLVPRTDGLTNAYKVKGTEYTIPV